MPELPEVEITRRKIESYLVDRSISRLVTGPPSYFFLSSPTALKRKLRGARFTALKRHGKYLLAYLDSERALLLHLGMTGQLFVEYGAGIAFLSTTARSALSVPAQKRHRKRDKHTHLVFEFKDDGPRVFFRDVRKFGKVGLIAPARDSRINKLGPDALTTPHRTLMVSMVDKLGKRRSPIKSALLDQSVLAGVGNIYADEALFMVGIRPGRRASSLTDREVAALIKAVRRVMRRSIKTGGSSISDYIQPDGSQGRYQDERKVYARQGQPCRKCDAKIRRVIIGARSSHYCPNCQK